MMRFPLGPGRILVVVGLLQICGVGTAVRGSVHSTEIVSSAEKDDADSAPNSLQDVGKMAFLTVGRRIKVEGRKFEGTTLLAIKIEVAEEDDDAEIEGILVNVDLNRSRLQISNKIVVVTDATRILNTSKEPLELADLRAGMRVKIKAEVEKDESLVAKSIRYYPGATDTDLEIEAPIEKIDAAKSELTLLAMQVKVSPDTQYLNPFGESDLSQFFDSKSRGIRRDDDEPDRPPIRIWKLNVGGRAGLAYRATENLDLLDRREDRDEKWLPQGRLELSLPVGEHSELYSKLTFSNPIELGEGSPNQFQFRVRELFFYWGNLFHRSVGLQIGRQRFRDKREWTYDDELDSLRLHVKTSKLRWELAAAKSVFRPTNSREDQLYFMGSVRYRLAPKSHLRGYFIKRNDLTPRDEDPVWFGVSSRGLINERTLYWAEASRMMGRHRRDRLRGYAFDVGGSYRFPLPWSPTLSGSYAHASGGEDQQQSVDRNFRQTRLQDNTDRLGGIRRYNYYGFLIDPELFNLKIPTVDLGLRPWRSFSVNFIYHNYRQVVASRDVGDMNLIRPANGRDPRLGQEIDAVITFRSKNYLDFNLLIGMFLPGPAFGQSVSPAWLVRPSIQFHF